MLEQWLKDAGYHVVMSHKDRRIHAYMHGDYAGTFYRYDKRSDWRCLHLGQIVTLSNWRKLCK